MRSQGRDPYPVFVGIRHAAGFTDGTMISPELCLIRAILGYALAVIQGNEMERIRWTLVFRFGRKDYTVTVREWWNGENSPITRRRGSRQCQLPRCDLRLLQQEGSEVLEEGGLSKIQRLFLSALLVRGYAKEKRRKLMESARMGGLLLEVEVLRQDLSEQVRHDRVLARLLDGVKRPVCRDLIRQGAPRTAAQRRHGRTQEGSGDPFKPVMTVNRLRFYLDEFPPFTSLALSMKTKSTGYVLFVWRRKGKGVVAVADCLRSEGGRAYVFEADSFEALIAFFGTRPCRDDLPQGGKDVRFVSSKIHGCSGRWRNYITATIYHLLQA